MVSLNAGSHMLDLPDESLLQIFRYLDYKDLSSLHEACQRFRHITGDDYLWRWQCQYFYLVNSCREGRSWKEMFINMHKEYGPYISCYRKIKGTWNKLEKYLERHCPSILQSLQDGASEEMIESILEDSYNLQSIPLDLRLSYRIHNGQTSSSHGSIPGLIGGGTIMSQYRSERFLPFSSENIDILKGRAKEWLLISFCLESFGGHFIDCSRESTSFGSVYITSRFLPSHRDKHPIECYDTGSKTFTDWFCNYVEHLIKDLYHVENEYIFRFVQEPGCEAETSGITVRPTTCFMPELSGKCSGTGEYFFAYKIIMKMDENASPDLSCQLVSRHWIITDGDGNDEEVDGPGVVGEYPIMRPGAEFTWISCCTFKSECGFMSGFFRMRNLRTGAMTQVECPRYRMQTPPRILVSMSLQEDNF